MLFCILFLFFFLMIRRPPRSTLDRSSAASDVYKRQVLELGVGDVAGLAFRLADPVDRDLVTTPSGDVPVHAVNAGIAVSYTHLRAHETVLDLVCRLLLEKKKVRSR